MKVTLLLEVQILDEIYCDKICKYFNDRTEDREYCYCEICNNKLHKDEYGYGYLRDEECLEAEVKE